MTRKVSRRSLLRAAIGGAGLYLLPSARAALGYQANERLQLAILGHMYVADHFFTSSHVYDGVVVTALCHPDQRKIPEVFAKWTAQARQGAEVPDPARRRAGEYYQRLLDRKPPVYADFRKMLEQRGDGIDAMVVSMFDHYHGVACGRAMRLGKHVFSERPLGLSIRESRALRTMAADRKVATSIRNPGNASSQFRRGVELVREGAIGPVEQVHVWFDRPGADLKAPPEGAERVPEGLDWDLWLGPAADRPYHSAWMAYAQWRDFSNGGIGTFGPHATNLAFAALRIDELWRPGPDGRCQGTIRVAAECPTRNRLSFPLWERIRWTVPARGDLPPVELIWRHGQDFGPGAREQLETLLAERGVPADQRGKLLGYAGAILLGSKGALVADDHNVNVTLLPTADYRDVDVSKPLRLPVSRGHYADWFVACRGGDLPWAHYGYAGPLSELLMLGNLATQFDAELEYDPLAGKIVNHAEADARLGYEYRQGWTL